MCMNSVTLKNNNCVEKTMFKTIQQVTYTRGHINNALSPLNADINH